MNRLPGRLPWQPGGLAARIVPERPTKTHDYGNALPCNGCDGNS